MGGQLMRKIVLLIVVVVVLFVAPASAYADGFYDSLIAEYQLRIQELNMVNTALSNWLISWYAYQIEILRQLQ